ncbi:HNH endonuclease [Streptomyces sp. CBG33]|uniref:HNH endonuclease n=1 Tax=Streptomyces sp. CBG33 TaxID=2762624 RepID=UPI0016495434|nr:HNH endonuclease [Streptomyces sp. CBG33]
MAWNSSRRERLPKNWESIRRRVLRRDGHACRTVFSDGRRCGAVANQVDHIVPGDDHRMEALQSLCTKCHSAKSAAEGGRAAALKRVRTARPVESHPALDD